MCFGMMCRVALCLFSCCGLLFNVALWCCVECVRLLWCVAFFSCCVVSCVRCLFFCFFFSLCVWRGFGVV